MGLCTGDRSGSTRIIPSAVQNSVGNLYVMGSTGRRWRARVSVFVAAEPSFEQYFKLQLLSITENSVRGPVHPRLNQKGTSKRGWQEQADGVGYAFSLLIPPFTKDELILYDESCFLCPARRSKDVQAGGERSGIEKASRAYGARKTADCRTRKSWANVAGSNPGRAFAPKIGSAGEINWYS